MNSNPHESLAPSFRGNGSNGRAQAHPKIEFDEQAGTVRLIDSRLFQAKRRDYARRLLETLCEQPSVCKAEVDLASSTFCLEVEPGSNDRTSLASLLTEAIQTATAVAKEAPWWRRSPRWSKLTGFRASGTPSVWESYEDDPGMIRLIHPGDAGDHSMDSGLAASLASVDGFEGCRVSRWSRRIVVDCRQPAESNGDSAVDRVEHVLESLHTGKLQSHAEKAVTEIEALHDQVAAASTWERAGYLALAGGSFLMTIVGLVVPGIPTVPFLLATSYCLARSSPALNARLRRTAFFGPILRECEGHSAISVVSKSKLIGLTAVIVVVAILLTPLSPLALILILIMSSLSIYGILRMPGLPADADDEIVVPGVASLALPA